MKDLFTVKLVNDADDLVDAVARVVDGKLRYVLVRDGEPVALLVPFSDRDALELGLWEKGAKEHLATIFGDPNADPLPDPAAYQTQELDEEPEVVPTDENFDLLETGVLMQFDTCRKCGKWVLASEKATHTC